VLDIETYVCDVLRGGCERHANPCLILFTPYCDEVGVLVGVRAKLTCSLILSTPYCYTHN
jgi:hypothetical protein